MDQKTIQPAIQNGESKDGAGAKHIVNGGTGTPGSKPKCFEGAELVPSAEDPTGIDLKMSEPRVPQDQEMRDLVRDIFAVEHVIRLLFQAKKYKPERQQFFGGLLRTATVGLCGTDYDVKAGQLDLSLTKDEIADAFPLLRDDLWKSYFAVVVWFTLIFATLGCLAYYHLFVQQVFADHNKALLKAVPALPQICLAAVLIPLGVPIGIFLEFVFRVGEKTDYEGLLAINPGRWKPWKRTASTLITAYVFAFIVGINAFQIGIGGVLLNNFISTQPWLSIAVGFVTGFTFPYVRDIVTQFKPERRDASTRNDTGGGNTQTGSGRK
jgi:hypothetical protein